MATISRSKIIELKSLDPGKTQHWVWNHAHYGKSYFLDIVPISVGTTATGFNHTTELEITRQWRKFITKEIEGSIGVTVDQELEIHYIVKNIGKIPAVYNVWLVEVD